MGPPPLGVFKVTCCRPSEKVEGIVGNAFDTMVEYVEFGQYKFGATQLVWANLHERWELGHAFGKIPGPLTANVVR